MRVAVLAVLVACGSSPRAPARIAKPVPTDPVTCHDASVILRGPLASDDEEAGPARESAILRSCEGDHWAPDVIACVGSQRKPSDCLAKLTEQQHQNYDAKLGTWEAQFGGSESGGVEGGDLADDKYTDCAQLIDDVSRYAPPYDDKVPERDWQTTLRKKLVETTCNASGWTEQTKECVLAAKDPLATEVCLDAEASAKQLAQQLTEVDTTAAKIFTAKKQPRSITCEKAVAAHYADARWKDRLKGVKAADKKRLISASRVAMQKACVADHWDDTTRACIVVSDQQRCYANALRWGYPALIAATMPNLPDECGMYKAAIDRIATCDSLPVSSRDAMKQAFDQASAAWTGLDADSLKALAPACRAGADAMLQAFPDCGGW